MRIVGRIRTTFGPEGSDICDASDCDGGRLPVVISSGDTMLDLAEPGSHGKGRSFDPSTARQKSRT